MDKNILKKIDKANTLMDYMNIGEEINLLNESSDLKIALLSNFTLKGLLNSLVCEAYKSGVVIDTYEGGYDQWRQEIMSESFGKFNPNLVFIALDLFGIDENLFYSYFFEENKTHDFFEERKNEVLSFIDHCKKNTKSKIVLFNFPTNFYRSSGNISDSKLNLSFNRLVREFNLWLEKKYLDDDRVFIFDFDGWLGQVGKNNNLYGNYFWLADMRISPETIPLLAKNINTYIKTYASKTKKCLVLDLDNTLWGGVLGEDGVGGIQLGPTGEGQVYYYLQKLILSLKKRGVILAINSKNNRGDLDDVFKNHPYMVLKEDDFVVIKANWSDKASNIKEISKELNIGIDSMVFLDDDPINRELVKSELPDVEVIELTDNPGEYLNILLDYDGFDSFSITNEDKIKSDMYLADKNRDVFKKEVDLESYLSGLSLSINIKEVDDLSLDRAVQLTQKTNQFNLTTRRYQKEDMKALIGDDKFKIFLGSVSDRFGDYGFTALAVVIDKGDYWYIDTMLLSCRVLGRNIEDQFLRFILNELKKFDTKRVVGKYIETKKNSQVKDFYSRFGFKEISGQKGLWELDLDNYNLDLLDFIKVIYE